MKKFVIMMLFAAMLSVPAEAEEFEKNVPAEAEEFVVTFAEDTGSEVTQTETAPFRNAAELVESWGGQLPIDHTVADACAQTNEFPDEFGEIGLCGLWEDDCVLLLDDGRILVTYLHHEAGNVLASVIFDPRNP